MESMFCFCVTIKNGVEKANNRAKETEWEKNHCERKDNKATIAETESIALQTSVKNNEKKMEFNKTEWNEKIECSNVSIVTNKLKGGCCEGETESWQGSTD